MSQPRPGREYACSKSCSECPFSRTYPIAELGPAMVDPMRLIGQAHSPFYLPCHMDPEYVPGSTNHVLSQCAGAAIYRANVGIGDAMPAYQHKLPADPAGTFTSPEELLAHHLRVSVEEAVKTLKACPPIDLTIRELKRAGPGKMMLSEGGARAGEGREIRSMPLQEIGMRHTLHQVEQAKAAGKTVLAAEDIKRIGSPARDDLIRFAQEHLHVEVR